MRRVIQTDDAPAAVGAYSQGIVSEDLVFTAGQVALTPDGDFLEDEPIEAQTRQALANLEAILAESGCGLEDVVKVTVFLADIDDFTAMNEVYGEHFDGDPPARSALEVGALPLGAKVEIEAVARRP